MYSRSNMFWQNAYFIALAMSIILILPSVNFPFMNIPADGQSITSPCVYC